jgi:Holliday junction resolvase RusA-like endonuclease
MPYICLLISQYLNAMKISITTENCNHDKYYMIEECADSTIHLELKFTTIVSIQSRKQCKEEICNLIQGELSKFKWIISGSVNVDLVWYLNDIERQETDKIGDIDNITKPILDSLTGLKGILIDDSQIRALYTFWISRNESLCDNILKIKISFDNDHCLEKQNLIFIKYSNAICLPVNVDPTDKRQLLGALALVKSRQLQRKAAKIIYNSYLIRSSWDFHRTRLGQFPNESIYSIDSFKKLCKNNGLTLWAILKMIREGRKDQNKII